MSEVPEKRKTMDFFEAQDNVHRSTFRLLILFSLVIAFIVFLTYKAASVLIALIKGIFMGHNLGYVVRNAFLYIDWQQLLITAAVVLVILLMAYIAKTIELGGGGKKVADSLGGRPLEPETANDNEKQVLNIVAEMGIASGIPVPPVYLMDKEDGINALALGYKPGDAVIGITRGATERLNRDELQGLIAHEFSHILNGDMRLNMHMVSTLYGILAMGQLGKMIIESDMSSSSTDRLVSAATTGRTHTGGGGTSLIGFAIMIIGYIGTFFGNLIKAAVNRQREYLADASAVQFTRNPDGIAGALKKVGGLKRGYKGGSYIDAAKAEEFSHAFFCDHTYSMFATHPTLHERIKRIEPDWDGDFLASKKSTDTRTDNNRTQPFSDAAVTIGSAAILSSIGRPTRKHLEQAGKIINGIPLDIQRAAREPYGARAVVYCLLIGKNNPTTEKQLGFINKHADDGVDQLVQKLYPGVALLNTEMRLPLIDLALPALRELTKSQYELFARNMDTLIRMDGVTSLFEWSLQQILLHHLDLEFGNKKIKKGKLSSLGKAQAACQVLVSCLINNRCNSELESLRALRYATEELGMTFNLLPDEQTGFDKFSEAIRELGRLKMNLRPRILKAALAAITQDEELSVEEMELMRAIADTLDCPMPVYIQ